MAKLIIHEPTGNERVHELVDDVTTLGRLSSNIVQIKDKEASRRHCQIERIPDGWRLADLQSRNGVTVNGKKVRNQTLRPGDKVTIGGFSIVFVAPELESATEEELGSTVESDPVQEEALKVAPEPEAKPHYILEVTDGRQRGKVIDLGTETLTIGRNRSNRFAIDDESASNYHAEISKEPTGYFLTDLGSTNGTFVKDEKIVKVRLGPGTEIRIGTTKMAFKNIGGRSPEDEVFGTVVLDTDKLEKELAEDTARARAAFVRRLAVGAAAAVVIGGVAWLAVWIARRAGEPEPVRGNMIANSSFDEGLTEHGEPLGWRRVGGRLTPWEVLTGDDRAPGRTSKAALRVSRAPEAALNEYAECRTREPVEVTPSRAYRLGTWIRTANTQGAYGVRVRWIGRDRRTATDQKYVMGTQPEWREIRKIVTPPAWAARAEVAVFAYGNTGKVDFDDVYFVEAKGPAPVPASLLTVAAGRIRAEFSPLGGFDVKSGTKLAVQGGMLFVVGADDAETNLEAAEGEGPREVTTRGGGVSFEGMLPDLSRPPESLRYKTAARPGKSGVALEYELSAEHSLPLSRAGVRFVVTGIFAEGPVQAFDENGALPEGSEIPEDVREVVFTGGEGEKLAVYLPEPEGEKPPRLRILTRGDVRLVEVLWPEQITLGRSPARLAVEFNAESRFVRLPVERAWKDYRTFKEQGNIAAQALALDRIVSMEEDFPEDAEDARKELDRVRGAVDREFKPLEDGIEELATAEGEVWKKLLAQVKKRLEELDEKYRSGEIAERLRELELKVAGLEEARSKRERGAEAASIFESVQKLIRNKNWSFAEVRLARLERDFVGTPAAGKAEEEGLRKKIEEGRQVDLQRKAAFEEIKRSADLFVRNGRYSDALSIVESNEDFPSLHGYRPFERWYEKIRQGAKKERESAEP